MELKAEVLHRMEGGGHMSGGGLINTSPSINDSVSSELVMITLIFVSVKLGLTPVWPVPPPAVNFPAPPNFCDPDATFHAVEFIPLQIRSRTDHSIEIVNRMEICLS